MTNQDRVKVGKKGEILPKKSLREVAGIHPGDQVLIEAHPGQIVIKKIYTIDELLAMPVIAEVTADEIEKELEKEGKKQAELTD